MKKDFWKLIVFLIVMSIVLVLSILIINDNANRIPTNYIAIFNGGEGEETYSTYIYNNGKTEDYGFKYINTTNKTVKYGSDKKDYKITKKGEVDWKDQLLKVAKDNKAYDYVVYKGKNISVEDFIKEFIKDGHEE